MKALGRPPVIWGTLLPLMILPCTADRIDEKVAILNIRLDREASIGWIAVNYNTVMILGLFAIGVGLSLQTLAGRSARSALQDQQVVHHADILVFSKKWSILSVALGVHYRLSYDSDFKFKVGF